VFLHCIHIKNVLFLFPVYLTNDLEHVSHVALRTALIFTKFEVA